MEQFLGCKGDAGFIVDEGMTAQAVKSGSLRVFSTPSLVALMEQAAVNALSGKLEDGKTSVGTRMDVEHIAATPLGMRVHAQAAVTGVDGRSVTFQITAFDEAGRIGEATHTRAVVDAARFMLKVSAKKI